MKRISIIGLVVIVSALLSLRSENSRAQSQGLTEGFQTRYASGLIVTPINTAIDIVPNGMVDLVFSASAEYSIRRAERLAYVFAAGYYPYLHRTEGILTFSLRTFFKNSEAPVGTFLDWNVITGVENDRPTAAAPNPETQPLFGFGLRLGSLRDSRFTSFAFEYGAGTSVVLLGGQPQFRAQLFFGIGFLFGKEVLVN